VAGLTTFFNQAPDRLNEENVQAYLLHLMEERKLSWSSCNVAVSGLRFFYGKTLGRHSMCLAIPSMKQKKQLPEILSAEELERLFASASNPKHRMLLMTTYGGGLRVSEVVRLKVTDIERDRMMIRVDDGKGNKDRYTILSERLLQELCVYWKMFRPPTWLFPGRDPHKAMHVGTAQKIYYTAKKRAKITRGKGIHTLRHYAEFRIMPSNPRNQPCLLGTSHIQLGIILLCSPPHILGNWPVKDEKHAELILRRLWISAALACVVIGSKHRGTVCIRGQYGFGASTRRRGIAFYPSQTVSGYAE